MDLAASATEERPAPGTVAFRDVAVHLHPQDEVAIAKIDLPPGLVLQLDLGRPFDPAVPVRQAIPRGHKVALRKVPAGGAVHRYGQVIGAASQAILPGEHVHTHNLGLEGVRRGGSPMAGVAPVERRLRTDLGSFSGYERADGRVGTRNYVAVIATVNCSAHACVEIARHFTLERLVPYPNVDGVLAFTHHTGCTNRPDSRDHVLLRRVLAGIACHPNVGAAVVVGLGCETNQAADLAEACGLCSFGAAIPGQPLQLVIQDLGGLAPTVEMGIAAVEGMLPAVDAVQRTPQPLSRLVLALQCGGSDSWSGVTANPVVGLVADEVVRQGGSVVLGETPEIYGAEHLLSGRATNPQVARDLEAQVRWWEAFARKMGMLVDDNRSAGNEAGGLTTIYEKSLGAAAKAGSAPLAAVYDYAEPVTTPGFVFMNTPGFDPVAVTGQVAGGCNLVLFTTGRGSVFGFKPAPCIKISSTSALYARMAGDMDLDAGRVLAGVPAEQIASELLDLIAAVASGQPSKSEEQDIGEAEFSPWILGGML